MMMDVLEDTGIFVDFQIKHTTIKLTFHWDLNFFDVLPIKKLEIKCPTNTNDYTVFSLSDKLCLLHPYSIWCMLSALKMLSQY